MTMTVRERELCRAIVINHHGNAQVSKEEFLSQFPAALQEGKLASNLLKDAAMTENPEDLQCALIVGLTFGFSQDHIDILCSLVTADWHVSHEDVISALDILQTPDALPAFFAATQWIPKYLEYDDCRALAVKAIWAIGRIPGRDAESRLKILANSDDEILRKAAAEQLERRSKMA